MRRVATLADAPPFDDASAAGAACIMWRDLSRHRRCCARSSRRGDPAPGGADAVTAPRPQKLDAEKAEALAAMRKESEQLAAAQYGDAALEPCRSKPSAPLARSRRSGRNGRVGTVGSLSAPMWRASSRPRPTRRGECTRDGGHVRSQHCIPTRSCDTRDAPPRVRHTHGAPPRGRAAEHQNFVEMVTKAAALQEVAELPKDLLKYRFRPSKRLVDLRENVTRLKGLGRKTLAECAACTHQHARRHSCRGHSTCPCTSARLVPRYLDVLRLCVRPCPQRVRTAV